MIDRDRCRMVRTRGFRAIHPLDGQPDESEKCTLSALCALFDNRSAAGTPSLAALQLPPLIAYFVSIDMHLGLLARNCAFMIEVQRGRARNLCLPSVS